MASLCIYFLSGTCSLFGAQIPWPRERTVPWGTAAASAALLLPVFSVLAGGGDLQLRFGWSFPAGSFHMVMDGLSAWFILPVILVSVPASFFGTGYLAHHPGKREVDFCGFFFQLLTGGIVLVLLASDGLLFLFAWEIMSISAFFLVMFEHRDGQVRRAGWVYLVATHLGTAFLFAMFLLLGAGSGTFDFSGFGGLAGVPDVVFLLAVIGFGAKAGFFGLHVWLPESHPAAPSHVSALMSGVMIKTGIYGILRVLTLAGYWPAWWGWLLLGMGIASGIWGAVSAAIEKDMKRVLAYSSVENMGIICIAMGIGVFGIRSSGPVAMYALAGALLHVLSHSVFKSCLFLGAGTVLHASGTREMDILGGLLKRMPRTGAAFLASCAAACALPPMNGFVSEFLIYLASFRSVLPQGLHSASLRTGGFLAISSLALLGGLAAMGFSRLFGIAFLGEARSKAPLAAADPRKEMLLPLVFLASLCLAFGMGGGILVRIAAPVAAGIHPILRNASDIAPLRNAAGLCLRISIFSSVLLAAAYGFWRLRQRLLKDREVASAPTWGCGYPFVSPRMQYTGSSFSQPLLVALRSILGTELGGKWPSGYLPGKSSFSAETPGLLLKKVYEPLFSLFGRAAVRMRRIQHGRTHAYVFYIILALIFVLFWSLLP